MQQLEKTPIERMVSPIQRFIKQEKSGGIVLGLSVIIALILANTPLKEYYHQILEYKFGFQWAGNSFFEYSVHHWINDGLMAIFFFVVGLELKREIVAGELSNPKKAILPIGAALGGMLIPAIIYFVLNSDGEMSSGWGIPMATDIAFALGVLYLLGSRIPLALKVFLTALAIVDDLGAVLVIALFYTSEISTLHLLVGASILLVMYLGNKMGVRNILFYAILGIGGVWTAFLLSGVHATIAAVLAAFTIPANVRISEQVFSEKIQELLNKFKAIDPDNTKSTLTNEQVHILEEIQKSSVSATPPLQRLEHKMHSMVTFVIIPIFALANAGVSLGIDFNDLFSTNIFLGVALGLLVGKVVGVVGFTLLLVKLKVAPFPQGMNIRNLFGLSLLSAIGFTMSLFVTSLAFTSEEYITQAKIGVFVASIIAGVFGYYTLSRVKGK
ncbi:Na+/H+ antiporter NhaA [Myroides injenensis]|uniref:Na+/H+ antiporter NhaA n=1 Tax=Myroides injenensis TaxID=1183151 RepID=UPI002270E8C8|nr:Na+/H+ antiporter NhaA [Myroides injenensis]